MAFYKRIYPQERLVMTDVDIWTIDLHQSAMRYAHAWRMCDTHERTRAMRIQDTTRQAQFVYSHAALREILSEYIQAPAQKVPIHHKIGQKPFVTTTATKEEIFFNLSHSGEYALCAVSRDNEVGVDVERVRTLGALDRIVRRVCSDDEARMLNGIPYGKRLEVFFRLWTRKEAVAKCVGNGLRAKLASINLPRTRCHAAPVTIKNIAVHVYDIEMDGGYYAAVATPTSDVRVVMKTYA
jgi:4'-phosphopantetheinyl transferase